MNIVEMHCLHGRIPDVTHSLFPARIESNIANQDYDFWFPIRVIKLNGKYSQVKT